MRRDFYRIVTISCLAAMGSTVGAQTQFFGPLPYLQQADTPTDFCEDCQLEDFEDNAVEPELTLSCGEILAPNTMDPLGFTITDSVDGDDGVIDGNGNAGHSLFCAETSISITFAAPVFAAGFVWTDGDRGVMTRLEAFDSQQNSLGHIDAGVLADNSFFGQTEEDRFLGIRSTAGIQSITVANVGNGAGLEIDHVQWDATEFTPTTPDVPTLEDVDLLCSAIAAGGNDAAFDQTGDGVLNADDIGALLDRAGTVLGDLNLDRQVDFSDFLVLSANFDNEASYSGGDVTCDGQVSFPDFLILSNRFGFNGNTAENALSVPEPTMATFLGTICLGLGTLCRKRTRR